MDKIRSFLNFGSGHIDKNIRSEVLDKLNNLRGEVNGKIKELRQRLSQEGSEISAAPKNEQDAYGKVGEITARLEKLADQIGQLTTDLGKEKNAGHFKTLVKHANQPRAEFVNIMAELPMDRPDPSEGRPAAGFKMGSKRQPTRPRAERNPAAPPRMKPQDMVRQAQSLLMPVARNSQAVADGTFRQRSETFMEGTREAAQGNLAKLEQLIQQLMEEVEHDDGSVSDSDEILAPPPPPLEEDDDSSSIAELPGKELDESDGFRLMGAEADIQLTMAALESSANITPERLEELRKDYVQFKQTWESTGELEFETYVGRLEALAKDLNRILDGE